MSNDRVLGVELAAGELVGLEDRHDLLDAGDRLERLDLQLVLVADHADDGSRDPLAEVGRETHRFDPLEDVVNDFWVGCGFRTIIIDVLEAPGTFARPGRPDSGSDRVPWVNITL